MKMEKRTEKIYQYISQWRALDKMYHIEVQLLTHDDDSENGKRI